MHEKYSSSAPMKPPFKLRWKIDSVVNKGIEDAKIFVDKLIGDSDLGVLHFHEYGSDWIKKNGRFICIDVSTSFARRLLSNMFTAYILPYS